MTTMTSNPSNPNKNTTVRRQAIQEAVAPAIDTALAGIPGIDLSRAEDRRRAMRAAVHAMAAKLLAAGEDPNVLAHACLEAIGKEYEALLAQQAQEGFTQSGANA